MLPEARVGASHLQLGAVYPTEEPAIPWLQGGCRDSEEPLFTPKHLREEGVAPSFKPQSKPSPFTRSSSRRSTQWEVGHGPKAEVTGSRATPQASCSPKSHSQLVGLSVCSAPGVYLACPQKTRPCPAARVPSVAQCHSLLA